MKLFITLFGVILVAGSCFGQGDMITNEDNSNAVKTVKALESAYRVLNKITEEYAHFNTERSDSGYSSSYLFKYEDEISKIYATTMTYSTKTKVEETQYIDSESDVHYTKPSLKKENMIPEKMLEFEYIFDMREIDPSKTELVSWEDETGEYNRQISPAMVLSDPSQNYQLTNGYYRVKFHTIDDKNRILVRSDLQDSETNAVSLYFSEKYYAEEFVKKFNQAVIWKKETSH